MQLLEAPWLGRLPYAEAVRLQDARVEARRCGEVPDALLLLEHPPVVTLGRASHPEHVLLDAQALASRGIELHESGRGGDVTWHGPGQLVGWPVLALRGDERDAHRWLRTLEECLIRTVAEWRVAAWREPGRTGAWTAQGKIGAIGVRIARGWITAHGFALNVAADLSGFDAIVPCGLRGRAVTSLARCSGRTPDLEDVGRAAAAHLAALTGRELVPGHARGAA
jgi:lipoyl(octanoyl) transferase